MCVGPGQKPERWFSHDMAHLADIIELHSGIKKSPKILGGTLTGYSSDKKYSSFYVPFFFFFFEKQSLIQTLSV